MPTPSHTVRCKKIESITHNVRKIYFEKPERFRFTPGQFILVDVPLLDDPSDIQPRAYSIASTPDEEDLMLIIKIRPGGRAGEWISKQLKEGDEVNIQGPLGVFGLDKNSPKDYLFICTGVGSAPFRSIIKSSLVGGEKRRMDLIVGVLAEEDIFLKKELDELSKEHENFNCHFTLSDPSEAWTGHKGYVQKLVPILVSDFSNKSIYVCGNPLMTDDVKKLCGGKWGVSKDDFYIEGYI